jgi:hypothetical protein
MSARRYLFTERQGKLIEEDDAMEQIESLNPGVHQLKNGAPEQARSSSPASQECADPGNPTQATSAQRGPIA